MEFELLEKDYAVCLLQEPALPAGEFVSLTISDGEISLVCESDQVPSGCTAELHWRALRIKGTLDFSLVGILAGVTAALAEVGVSVFAISTYKTDYVFVKQEHLACATAALKAQGHVIV